MKKFNSSQKTFFLWVSLGLILFCLLISKIFFPTIEWLSFVLLGLVIANITYLIIENKKALTGRAAAYSINSIVTVVLVLALLGLINFIAIRYPKKLDLTKNKIHTLSDQTTKVVKNLSEPLTATFFGSLAEKEKNKNLFENYTGLNPNFKFEYADKDKDIVRAKKAGVTKSETLLLSYKDRTSKIEGPTEEKLTNAIIKLVKEKRQTLCNITGHGERDFNASDENGYATIKQGLENQTYTLKELNLPQQKSIPQECDAIALLGPQKAFFDVEVKMISEYLNEGGRAMIALDLAIDRPESFTPIMKLLEQWHVKVRNELIIDPVTGQLGGDLATVIVSEFSKDSPITKDHAPSMQGFFPVSRPLEIISNAHAGLNVSWLLKTMPTSWGETNLEELKKGKLNRNPGQDIVGPLTVGVTIEGKAQKSKATRNTRIVVFGTSLFARNAQAKFGGNYDLFLNAASWTLEDESLISIRTKEEGSNKVTLSKQAGLMISWLTIIIIPLLVAIMGIVIWVRRRKL